jgi:hypothetical protein
VFQRLALATGIQAGASNPPDLLGKVGGQLQSGYRTLMLGRLRILG